MDRGGSSHRPKKGKKNEKKPDVRLTPSDEKFPTDLEDGATKTDFDWLTKKIGALRAVRNQGNRRACWTIASTTSLAASLVIANRFDPDDVELSALHMLVGLIERVDASGGLQNLEHLRRFMIDCGAISEGDCSCPQLALQAKNDPSKPNPILCTDKGKAKQIRTFKVKDLIILNVVDERELIRLVVNLGVVAVGIKTGTAFNNFEGDGIYDGNEHRTLDKHMLVVYGYDTDTSTGTHYWKVQNSVGPKWGKNGYGKIIRQISRTGRGAHNSLFTFIMYPQLLDHYEGQK